MPFLKLSGITVPVLATSGGAVNVVNVGEYGRGFSGTPYSAVRAEGLEYPGRTPLLPRATSTALGLLIAGKGEAYRFVRPGTSTTWAYSTKGRPIDSASGAYTLFATGGKIGPRLHVSAGEAPIVLKAEGSPLGTAALAFWMKGTSGTGGVWKHYVLEQDETQTTVAAWVNGVSTALGSLPHDMGNAWMHSSPGGETYTELGNVDDAVPENLDFAEVILLPYRPSLIDSTWAAWLYNGGAGLAAEDLPYLTMEGSWRRASAAPSEVVLGEVGQENLFDVGSELYSSLDFTLRARTLEAP